MRLVFSCSLVQDEAYSNNRVKLMSVHGRLSIGALAKHRPSRMRPVQPLPELPAGLRLWSCRREPPAPVAGRARNQNKPPAATPAATKTRRTIRKAGHRVSPGEGGVEAGGAGGRFLQLARFRTIGRRRDRRTRLACDEGRDVVPLGKAGVEDFYGALSSELYWLKSVDPRYRVDSAKAHSI